MYYWSNFQCNWLSEGQTLAKSPWKELSKPFCPLHSAVAGEGKQQPIQDKIRASNSPVVSFHLECQGLQGSAYLVWTFWTGFVCCSHAVLLAVPPGCCAYSHLTAFHFMFSLPGMICPWLAAWLTPWVDLGFFPHMSHCQWCLLWPPFVISHPPF